MTTIALNPGWRNSYSAPSAVNLTLTKIGALFQWRESGTPSALAQKICEDTLASLFDGFQESQRLALLGDFIVPSNAALSQAQELINSLPTWAGAPRPLFEHEGAIALEWDVGEGKFFVAALDGTGYVDYSAVLGLGEEHYGRVPFKGRLPDQATVLLAQLKRA